jgi:drug/metabolite transporter (DMT)-like permease
VSSLSGAALGPRPDSLRLIGAFAAVYLFWGATFLAIRYVVAEVPPLATMAIRCGGGAAILFGWLAWRGELEPTTRSQWSTAFAAGTLLFLGCHAILASVEQRVPSGQAALLLTSIPLSLVAITALKTRRVPPIAVLVGLGVGVVGIGVLAKSERGQSLDLIALGIGGVLWALGSTVGRDGPRPRSVAQSSAMQLLAGAVVLTIVSVAIGEPSVWPRGGITPRAAWSLGFLVTCGTVIAFAAYNWLLTVTSPAAAGSYAFVNPIVAVALAWVAGDESPTVRTGIAATLVTGAVALTSIRQSRE